MMITLRKVIALCIYCNFAINSFVNSSKILGLFPSPIRSNFIMYEALMKGLADKGHEVYVVSHFPQTTPYHQKSYHDISIKGSVNLLDDISIEEISSATFIHLMSWQFNEQGRDLCQSILQHPEMEALKNSSIKFDVLIVEIGGTDCLLGFSHLFKAPSVGISATLHKPWALERMGNPDNPSYMPNYFIPHQGKQHLLNKIIKVGVSIGSKIAYYFLSTIPSEMRAREFFGEMAPLDELAFKTSIYLSNTHLSIDEPIPTVPGVVEVGGLHISKSHNTPLKLQQFLSSTTQSQGFIYFSMSTTFDINTFDKAKMDVVLKVLSKLPYKLIMRNNQSIVNEENKEMVYAQLWLPQQEILCHPKTVLFVTSGGQMSVQEAANCGVPILGIPFFSDQILSVLSFKRKNAGEFINYAELNEETFSQALNLVLNSNYTKAAKEVQRKFKDRPLEPLKNAIYWVEYVIRYNGAQHLRTFGADLIWFEYFSVDVALVFAFLFAAFIGFLIVVLNFLQNFFDVEPNTTKKQQQKTKKS